MMTSLESEIQTLASSIAALKSEHPKSELIFEKVEKLKALKKQLAQSLVKPSKKFNRSALESTLLKRFFFAPSFEIYGGIAGLYDYGPPGTALQTNILSLWRSHFVLQEDMLEIETTNLTPEVVLKTSGHVDRFADYMVKDLVNGDIFRADHLIKHELEARLEEHTNTLAGVDKKKKGKILSDAEKAEIEEILDTLDNYQGKELHELIVRLGIKAPESKNDLSEPVMFNLMFDTQIGPTGQFKGYLRPETAQAHFLNFKRLYDFNSQQMPFASASIGKSFRNEISPRQGLLRVREFTMAEIEHFVDPLKKDHPRFDEVKDYELPLLSADAQLSGGKLVKMSIGAAVEKGIVNNQTLGYFMVRIYLFLLKIGVKAEKLRFRQHMNNEMAHYACDCWDAEIESSYGWIECVGCADRSAYDLGAHGRKTGENLVAREVLPEPIVKTSLVLELVKSKFGPVFKKNAKFVQGYFDTLLVDGSWDESKLKALQEALEKDGKAVIQGTDGNNYEITKDMVQIFMKTEKTSIREYIPNVIEPSFGIGRILYSLLEHSYYTRPDDEAKSVFSFSPLIAPTKVLICPISNQPEFVPFIKKSVLMLRNLDLTNKVDDSSGSIGRRYARNDELGTPFALTIDFQSVADGSVTLRERDSTRQVRGSLEELVPVIKDLVDGRKSWSLVESEFSSFTVQELAGKGAGEVVDGVVGRVVGEVVGVHCDKESREQMRKRTVSDFKFGKSLGQGSFSHVLLATEISNSSVFAVKILDKKQIIREKKVKYVDIEKQVLNSTNHPLVIKLYYTFQDTTSLYFVLELAKNGDLLALLKKLNIFSTKVATFYSAQVILALEYLHSMGILHRDIKPENILLDERMHIKITDFGSAKIQSVQIVKEHVRKSSFVGTAEYCSPELLNDRNTSEKSDIWALGVLLFQLLSGRHAFRGPSEYLTFQKILNLEYSFPLFFSESIKTVLKSILVIDSGSRSTLQVLKCLEFYSSTDFKEILNFEISCLLIESTTLIEQEPQVLQLSRGILTNSLQEYIEKKSLKVEKSGNFQTRIGFTLEEIGITSTKDELILYCQNSITEISKSEILAVEQVSETRFYILFTLGILHLSTGSVSDSARAWVEHLQN